MDFGSAMKARVPIENRSQALLQQVCKKIKNWIDIPFLNNHWSLSSWPFKDIAAEQSTMAYRAPELFDVKTGQTLDEKVDIWVCPHSAVLFFQMNTKLTQP